jgi:chromosome segregation ATPase|nr:MAG TPA: chromosome segregation protein [Caudoviricetes sp.]
MAEIDGGALSFKSIMDNDQLNGAIEETLRRVQGFSDAVVGSGDAMDSTTKEMVECIEIQKKVIQDLETTVSELNARIDSIEPGDAQNVLIEQANAARKELDEERKGLAALESQLNTMQQANAGAAMSFEQVRSTLGEIGAACEIHEKTLANLEAEYDRLGAEMGKAYMSGRDDEYIALKQQQTAIQGEIRVRKSLLNELRDQSNALEEVATKIETERANVEKAANAHTSLRSKIREVKEEMANLRANGIDENSAAYKNLVNELGRLQDIQGDIQAQGSIMANDENQFAGMLSGLQGVVGGFTAAQGAVALFGAENEELQRIMLKVQSLMSITMGLQQVAQTLNKDSAFSLVTLNKAKEWWNNLLDVGRGKQIADTAAMEANTVAQATNTASKTAGATAETAKAAAQTAGTAAAEANTVAQGVNTAATGAQTVAATAGTAANIGLAGAFRMVGAAIKSIPVFGWILAGISALIALVSHFVGKANEAKKAQEEWYKSVAENVYKPVAAIEELSVKWNQLGDNLEAKKRFIEANKKAFDDLGVSINDVRDAENLLSDPAQVQKFVNAQIKKAEAMIYVQQAQEKVKTLMEQEQKYKNMSDTRSMWVQTSNFGTGYYVQVRNKEKDELKVANEALRKEIEQGFKNAAAAETAGATILKNAGIDGANTYKDGTLGAIQEAIRTKQEALNTLTNNDDYKKAMKEIEDLQKQADKITGAKRTTGGGGRSGGGKSSTQDPFLEKLAKYKSEYTRFMKWINSGDEVLVKAANQEFGKLLQEGATYIEYLKNQRDTILQVDVANRTKAQNKQLRQLNDAIAEETKNTVLEAFNNELSEQLTNAKSILEMLNIIEKKRKELSGDGTELDNAKKETLDTAEKDAQTKLKEETESLLEEYASYMEKRRRIDEQYNADITLLNQRRAQAQSDSERAEIDAAIRNRTRKYETDTKGSGNTDYDAMLADYGTFEQRKQAIIDSYAEKRRITEEMGNQDMIDALDKAQQQALSKFALDQMKMSPDWELMFGDLDGITTKKLEELIAKINGLDGAYLGIEFDPKDLETLKKKIEEMKDEIQERNPFKALISSIKDYSKAADSESKKKALSNMFESATGAIDLVKGSLNAVVSGMDKMGIAMDENTQAILGDIGGILDGASQISQGIATGNPLSVIQGSIGLLSSAFDLFNSRDRKAEKQIKKHQKAIKDLENAYKQLEWQIDKALGVDVYEGQMQAIHNMEAQRQHLQQMWEAEESKKKTDHDRVKDFKEQYADLGRQIEDMYDSISKDILQTDAKDFAGSLGDSLVEAFKKGEDASKAFETTVNEVLQNAVVNQLKKRFLEQQLQGALDQLESNMGYWNGDDFVFDGLTDAEIEAFKRKVQAAANNYNQALGIYSDLFKDITGDEDADTSLTGAVKGVTEETASIVAGQMNAIRINQLEATAVLRQSLQQLNMIAANTQYNRYLVKIDRIISLLEKSGDSLRSQGLS